MFFGLVILKHQPTYEYKKIVSIMPPEKEWRIKLLGRKGCMGRKNYIDRVVRGERERERFVSIAILINYPKNYYNFNKICLYM